MYAEAFELPRDLQAFRALHTATETVVHVHLDQNAHIVSSLFHDALYDHAHQAHTVLKRAAKTVVPVVGVWREELADQVAVAGVDLDAVEASTARQADCIAEIVHEGVNLVLAQRACKRRGVEVETSGSPDGHASAGGPVSHIAAVPQLDGCLRPLGMHGVGDFPQRGYDLLAHPQLAVERQAAPVHGSVCQRGHPHPSPGHGHMVVHQVLRGFVAVGHILEGSRSDDAVAERHRTYFHRSKDI